MSNRNEQATAAPTTIKLGERLFVLAKPTAADELTIQAEWKRMCFEESRTPLQAVAADLSAMTMPGTDGKPALNPMLAKMVIEAAVAQQSAAGKSGIVEPDDERVMAKLFTPEGARFRFWYLAKKIDPALKLSELEPLITSDNVMEVVTECFRGLGMGDDDEKKE